MSVASLDPIGAALHGNSAPAAQPAAAPAAAPVQTVLTPADPSAQAAIAKSGDKSRKEAARRVAIDEEATKRAKTILDIDYEKLGA